MAESIQEKIIAEVLFPAAEKVCQVRIPLDLRVYDITLLLTKLFSDTNLESYSPTNRAVLCDGCSGIRFSGKSTPRELGWENGIRLLLI